MHTAPSVIPLWGVSIDERSGTVLTGVWYASLGSFVTHLPNGLTSQALRGVCHGAVEERAGPAPVVTSVSDAVLKTEPIYYLVNANSS